jgi:23S rRNA (guanosine2251-2'-O)-methyltransferase
MAIAKVTNISATVDELKKKGLWIFAAEAGGAAYYETDFNTPAAIIFGSEGFGVGKAIKEKSDFVLSLPMRGKITSLNASVASSIMMYEVARQRLGIKAK